MKRLLMFKKVQIAFSVFVLLAIFTNCSKDKQELIENTWSVMSIKIHADSAWVGLGNWDWDPVTLSFMDKDRYIFQASSYCVIDRVKIGKNNKIEFELLRGVSTNSNFAGNCWLLLSRINHYEIDGYSLVLTGNKGETINLTKKYF